MPWSLAPTSVDIVADLENIGPMLKELSTHPATTKQNSEKNAVAAILETLRQQHGIDFSTYKAPTIIRRLHRRMVATGQDTMADYRRRIAEDPEESVRLISSFLIKVTEFFRDKDLFEHLRHHVIPSLITEARDRGNEIRIWSAGCATGEEPYSIAILLSEALASEIDDFSIRIVATDLDPDAVAFARRGVYPAPSLANVSPEILDRYFTKTDNEYEIKKRSAASPFLASTTWVTGRRFRVWTWHYAGTCSFTSPVIGKPRLWRGWPSHSGTAVIWCLASRNHRVARRPSSKRPTRGYASTGAKEAGERFRSQSLTENRLGHAIAASPVGTPSPQVRGGRT
jgi:hypothetical protein